MLIGLVKWINAEDGYGLIGTFKNGDFFINDKSFLESGMKIIPWRAFIFESSFDNSIKRTAVNCRLASTYEDFSFILKNLKEQDEISIEEEIANGVQPPADTEDNLASFKL